MKIKSLVLLLALTFSLSLVNAAAEVEPTGTLTSLIKQELSQSAIDFQKHDGETLHIKFMINEAQELIVVSTSNEAIDGKVKSSLNYDKIESTSLVPFQVYAVKVTLKSGKF